MQSARKDSGPDLKSVPDPSSAPAGDESLLDLLAALFTLIHQTLADHVALARIELRLALKSVVLISLLLSCLALLGVLMGITALFGVGYFAFTLGAHWAVVVFGLLIGQGLMVWGIIWQVRKLAKTLGFPASRQALKAWKGAPANEGTQTEKKEAAA
jgi:uncharacterized membrane protein YqjE